jgi:catechol 2,3-dioxygenase-like lactoylglutathione lyase family enzyme
MTESRLITALTPELACANIRTSVAFYTDVLGFGIQYQRPEDGFAMLERQGSRIMLDEIRSVSITGTDRSIFAAPLEAPFGRGMNLQIATDAVDNLYANVQRSGAKVFRAMEERWYRADNVRLGNRQFIVQDPDGYLLRFFQDLGEREDNGVSD